MRLDGPQRLTLAFTLTWMMVLGWAASCALRDPPAPKRVPLELLDPCPHAIRDPNLEFGCRDSSTG